MGVPVLASRVGALPDIIQDGTTGWLCERSDLEAFAERIEQAARDPVGLKDMRRQARTYAEAELGVHGMLAAYRTGLISLLPEDRRHG
jgi:glycosyltransferase involved in cell wall biosynthesis